MLLGLLFIVCSKPSDAVSTFRGSKILRWLLQVYGFFLAVLEQG